MSDYRRCYLPGGSFFFTVVTERRANILCTDLARQCLRNAFLNYRQRWRMGMEAWVLLGDHLHAIRTLPRGDTDYSKHVDYIHWNYVI